MKYLDYINHLWRINEVLQISCAAVALYFYLLHTSNRTGWDGYVVLSDAKIMADLGINRTALSSARTALERVGLINLRNRGNGRGKTVYDIISPNLKNCTKHADLHHFVNIEETAQNMQIDDTNNCTKRAFKNVKNCTDNCTKHAVSHIINNISSNTNVLSDISYKTKNIVDSEYKYSSSTSSTEAVDDVARKFLEEVSDTHFVRHATTALSISREQYLRLAQTIISEWLITEPENFLQENSPKKHLINQVRIKRDHPGEQKAQTGARSRIMQQQEQKENAEQLRRELSEERGPKSLKDYMASKGLKPGDSILTVLSPQQYSEEQAIQDVRHLFASEATPNS